MARGLLVGIVMLGGAGCATPAQVTWGEAVPPVVTRTTQQRATPHEPVRIARAQGTSPGFAIDSALQMFLAARAVLRAVPPTASQHGEAWDAVLEQIDEACLQMPEATDLGAFVRARVVLEVELDNDKRRRVALPADLGRRLRRTLLAVDDEVAELRLIAAPGTMRPSPRLIAGSLILRQPLSSMTVSSPFGVRADPINGFKRFHAGVDLSAAEGVMVYASAPGTVIYAGWQGGYGRHVVVDHGDGFRTHYSHLQDLFVKVGQLVDEREPMAAVGSTGRSTGPHLHFAVTNAAGSFLDPLTVLGAPLLPEPVETAAIEGVPLAMTR